MIARPLALLRIDSSDTRLPLLAPHVGEHGSEVLDHAIARLIREVVCGIP
jgi:hypothetical protein